MTEFIMGHGMLCVGLAVALLVLLALWGWLLARRHAFAAFGVFCFGVFCFFWSYYALVEPKADLLKSTKPFLHQYRALIPENERVAFIADFNVETVFFLNRSYSREILPDTCFVITNSKKKLEPKQWRKIGSTPDEHFYPQVLYKRISR